MKLPHATGFVNNVNPRGFGDIHYDTQVSDLSTGNSETKPYKWSNAGCYRTRK